MSVTLYMEAMYLEPSFSWIIEDIKSGPHVLGMFHQTRNLTPAIFHLMRLMLK